MRGVNDGYDGEFRDDRARMLLDMLDLFGEGGVRMYLVGILEGEEDAEEDEAAVDLDAMEVIVDYETGEVTPVEREDEDEDDLLDDPDLEEDPSPNESAARKGAGPECRREAKARLRVAARRDG